MYVWPEYGQMAHAGAVYNRSFDPTRFSGFYLIRVPKLKKIMCTGFCWICAHPAKAVFVKENPEQGPTGFYLTKMDWKLLDRESSKIK